MTARTAPNRTAASAKTSATDSATHVRLAAPIDAPALAELAARTFTATYARGGDGPVATSDPADVAAYVASHLTVDHLRAALRDPDVVTFVAESTELDAADDPNGARRWAGYAQLRVRPVPGDVPLCAGPRPCELARLYVERAWQGRGVADVLVDAVEAHLAATQGGADPLWLAVYQANTRAVAFYRRRGFAIVGATTFTMGAELQHDWVMAR